MAKLTPQQIAAHRARSHKQRRKAQIEDSDIGDIPKIVNPKRRKACKFDLERYLLTYHGMHFPLPFGEAHRDVIAGVQYSVFNGGARAKLLPRGTGKSTILLFSVMWIANYGHRKFPFLAPGDGEAAAEMLSAILQELLDNPYLYEDFPEICYPVIKADGIAVRANFQRSNGISTGLKLGKYIRYPQLDENRKQGNDGVIIKAKGFLGAVRGKVMHLPDRTVRPDFYLIDDPQTLESAYSETETKKRKKIIKADLLRGAGPNVKPAAICLGTMIRKGDLVDQMLNPKEFVGWDVLRVQFLTTWPTNMELWSRYADLRRQAMENRRSPIEADAMYVEHREEMDAGAVTYWADRIDPGSISSIQTAMNRWIDDPVTFASEDQNDPLDDVAQEGGEDSLVIVPEDVTGAIRPVPKLAALSDTVSNVGFIDVSGKVLWWMVASFTQDMSGHVVDYGTWPDNGRDASLSTIRFTLRSKYGGKLDEAIYAGVSELISILMERHWETQSGDSVTIDMGLVDSKWGLMNKVVRKAAWNSDYKSIWMPYEGKGIKASSRALNDTDRKAPPREVRGEHWRKMPEKEGSRAIADSNYWKSFTAKQIKDGRFTIYAGGTDEHRMLIDHWTAEYPVRVERKERSVDEWQERPSRRNNHMWDAAYGCHVAASMLGLTGTGQDAPMARRKRRVVSFAEIMRQRRGGPHG